MISGANPVRLSAAKNPAYSSGWAACEMQTIRNETAK
jgi:hypothetical protein